MELIKTQHPADTGHGGNIYKIAEETGIPVENLIDFSASINPLGVPERAKDVIIFDPADTERPMGLNILEANSPAERDLISSQATEIFIKLFGDEIFGRVSKT